MGQVIAYEDPMLSRHVVSFAAALEAVEDRIGLDALIREAPWRDGIYREVARIMADVYTHALRLRVTVCGESLCWWQLADVMDMVTGDHVKYVVDRLMSYDKPITYKKAWLRTALYNAVFEMETEAATGLTGGNV